MNFDIGGFYHLTEEEYNNEDVTFDEALAHLNEEREKLKKLETKFKEDYKQELRERKLNRIIDEE